MSYHFVYQVDRQIRYALAAGNITAREVYDLMTATRRYILAFDRAGDNPEALERLRTTLEQEAKQGSTLIFRALADLCLFEIERRLKQALVA